LGEGDGVGLDEAEGVTAACLADPTGEGAGVTTGEFAGLAVPTGEAAGVTAGEFAGLADPPGDAAGVAFAPGCVPGLAGGGLDAAAGCPRFSDCGPATDVAFGVALACGLADDAAEGAGEAAAGAVPAAGSGVAIDPAGAGFFCDNSAMVSFMAWSIGILATPLFLSTQAKVPSAPASSSRNFFKLSARVLARVRSYVSARGDGPMTARTITPKKKKRISVPSQAEKGARDCATWRNDSSSAI
jgi:hypothetical protein